MDIQVMKKYSPPGDQGSVATCAEFTWRTRRDIWSFNVWNPLPMWGNFNSWGVSQIAYIGSIKIRPAIGPNAHTDPSDNRRLVPTPWLLPERWWRPSAASCSFRRFSNNVTYRTVPLLRRMTWNVNGSWFVILNSYRDDFAFTSPKFSDIGTS
jgi:hypothetical protein